MHPGTYEKIAASDYGFYLMLIIFFFHKVQMGLHTFPISS